MRMLNQTSTWRTGCLQNLQVGVRTGPGRGQLRGAAGGHEDIARLVPLGGRAAVVLDNMGGAHAGPAVPHAAGVQIPHTLLSAADRGQTQWACGHTEETECE